MNVSFTTFFEYTERIPLTIPQLSHKLISHLLRSKFCHVAGYLCPGTIMHVLLPAPRGPIFLLLVQSQNSFSYRISRLLFPASAIGQSALIDRRCMHTLHKRFPLQTVNPGKEIDLFHHLEQRRDYYNPVLFYSGLEAQMCYSQFCITVFQPEEMLSVLVPPYRHKMTGCAEEHLTRFSQGSYTFDLEKSFCFP